MWVYLLCTVVFISKLVRVFPPAFCQMPHLNSDSSPGFFGIVTLPFLCLAVCSCSMCAHSHTHTHTHAHTRTHSCTHTCTRTHTHTLKHTKHSRTGSLLSLLAVQEARKREKGCWAATRSMLQPLTMRSFQTTGAAVRGALLIAALGPQVSRMVPTHSLSHTHTHTHILTLTHTHTHLREFILNSKKAAIAEAPPNNRTRLQVSIIVEGPRKTVMLAN